MTRSCWLALNAKLACLQPAPLALALLPPRLCLVSLARAPRNSKKSSDERRSAYTTHVQEGAVLPRRRRSKGGPFRLATLPRGRPASPPRPLGLFGLLGSVFEFLRRRQEPICRYMWLLCSTPPPPPVSQQWAVVCCTLQWPVGTGLGTVQTTVSSLACLLHFPSSLFSSLKISVAIRSRSHAEERFPKHFLSMATSIPLSFLRSRF